MVGLMIKAMVDLMSRSDEELDVKKRWGTLQLKAMGDLTNLTTITLSGNKLY